MAYQKVNGVWTQVGPKRVVNFKSASKTTEDRIASLLSVAQKNNLANEVKQKTPKLSFLQRLGTGLNTFNPVNAIYGAEFDGKNIATQYGKDIGRRLTSAFTGKIPTEEDRSGSDLVAANGISNKVLKFGLGFAADVLLDPTTYFGGAIVKGAAKGVKFASKPVVGVIRKIAPEALVAAEATKTGITEALGKAFQRGSGSSKGLLEHVTDVQGKLDEGVQEVFKNSEMRTGILSPAQRELAGQELAQTRRNVLEATAKKQDELRLKYETNYGKMPEATADTAIRDIERSTSQKVARNQKIISYLQRDITKAETSDLTKIIADLRAELPKTGKKVLQEAAPVTFSDTEKALTSTINLARRQKQEIIGALEAKLKYAKPEAQAIGAEVKTVTGKKSWSQKIVSLNQENVRLMNEAADKTRLIQGIRDARQIVRPGVDVIPDLTKKGFTAEQQAVVAGEVARAEQQGQQLVRAGKLQAETIPTVYFPSILKDPEKLKQLQSMLSGSKHFGTGSEGYLKQYRALLKDKDLVLDFSKAYSVREAEVLKDLTMERELKNIVKKFGVKTEAEAKKLGYVPITRKGFAGKIGEVIGYVSKADAELLGAFMGKAEFATLDLIAKRLGFDAATSLFKRSVTGLFAPFHIRNWVSGIIQNYEVLGPAALNPRNMALGSRISKAIITDGHLGAETIELAGKTYQLQSLMKRLKYRFYGGSYIADLGDATKVLVEQGKVITPESLRATVKTVGLGSDAIPFRAARKVGEFIETQQKATAFITAMSQGKTVDDALNLARQAGFDYRNLTGFESKILRRIIPFYAFARFNAELQIKTILQHPDRVNNLVKMFRNAGDAFGGGTNAEERESLPDYLTNGFGFKIGTDKNGNSVYTNSFGTPVEAFTSWFDKNPVLKVMSNMNPILKVPTELGIGKDSFRQQDLSITYSANEYSNAPKIVKDLLQLKPVQKDKYKDGNPTGEKYTIYVANPERLLIARGLFTSRGATYLDQVFDGDLQGMAKALNLITGVKSFPVDLERTKEFQLRDQQQSIEDTLIRYGVARQYRNVYVPKKPFNPGTQK